MEESIVRSSINELEAFKESFIWKDIVDELNLLNTVAQAEYDTVGDPLMEGGHRIYPNTSKTLIDLGHIKGRREAVAYFLDIIEVLIQKVESQKLNKSEVSNE